MSKTDAITLLKDDHDAVKKLFEQFEAAEDKRTKSSLAKQAILELKIHATIEEELFYPVVRKALKKAIGKEDTTDLMDEADEEHHVAKLLIAELETMKASDDHWEAKFTVLSENILHHVKEEEGEMVPQARKLDLDYETLGQQMQARKDELRKAGVPTFAEEALISQSGIADSPAEAALASSVRH
ncbi:MAG: hemerythrin domain-containing protein [Asticcacaulis sp.]